MAVDTGTVQVVMPAMGDSVAEGTVLEWRKQEGDAVAIDETLVEISTDKVDAEVPAPVAGTVVKIHAGEGDTVTVGSLLAEISTNGAVTEQLANPPGDGEPATPEQAVAAAETEAQGVAATQQASGETVDIVTPTGGESVTEGTVLEWAVKVGDAVKDGDTVVEISTDKVDMELPAPASGTITEILAEEGDTVTVGQVIARMTIGDGAQPAPSAPSAASPQPDSPRGVRNRPPRRRPRSRATAMGRARLPSRAESRRARVSISGASRAAPGAAGSPRPTCSPQPPTAVPWPRAAARPPPRPRPPRRLPPRPRPAGRSSSRAVPRSSPGTWIRAARSPPRPRSAR